MLIALLSLVLAFAAPVADSAESVASVDTEAHVERRPVRGNLPGLPYAQTDFTAYAVEPGAARVGLFNLSVGVLPRLHVSTVVALAAVGVANGQVKWNALRAGPVDLGVSGGFAYRDDDRGFMVRYFQARAHLSVRVADPVSVHLIVGRHVGDQAGVPWLLKLANVDTSGIDPSTALRAWTVELASDLRFNRRDALVLRFRAADARASARVDDVYGTGESIAVEESAGLGTAWMGSVAWQLSWRTVQLRLGGTTTSLPELRLMPTIDVTLWFGGETRRAERDQLATWRGERGRG